MLLYPLKVKSWRSMQKMQKVAPEIRQIQDRYKKYSMRDPRKAGDEQRSDGGVQPRGHQSHGELPADVVQLPIWFALYRMLTVDHRIAARAVDSAGFTTFPAAILITF